MQTSEIIETLKGFHKWFRGKGKKYVNGEVDIVKVGNALKCAITHLSRRVDKDEFIALVELAEECICVHRKKQKFHTTDLQKSALKSGRKVVRFLLKNNG